VRQQNKVSRIELSLSKRGQEKDEVTQKKERGKFQEPAKVKMPRLMPKESELKAPRWKRRRGQHIHESGSEHRISEKRSKEDETERCGKAVLND